jgi:hypothetical protein
MSQRVGLDWQFTAARFDMSTINSLAALLHVDG